MKDAFKKAGLKPTFDIKPLTKEHIEKRILARDRGICAGKLNREGKAFDPCPYTGFGHDSDESDFCTFWEIGFKAAMNYDLAQDIQQD